MRNKKKCFENEKIKQNLQRMKNEKRMYGEREIKTGCIKIRN